MTSAKVLRLQGTVQSRGDASAYLKSSGDAVLIERGRPRWLLLSCPCGCGEEFPINLDPRAGPAWRLYMSRHTGISLYPSVWRESGCESHYVIWRDKIFLFGRYEDDFENTSQTDETTLLAEAVRKRLPIAGLIPFSEVAEYLNEVPWDVLMVCRHLVRNGLAHEGGGKQRGSFGRLRDTYVTK